MEEKIVQDVEENVGNDTSSVTADAVPPSPQGEGNGEALVTPAVQRQYEIWKAQAQEAKNLYPGLDMARELQNPQFAHLLKSGVDVRTAFEVVHRDQILPAAMQAAARAVERKLTAAMAGARPPESAMERVSPALARTDVSSMSKADRAEIIRRVRRGEIIRF